MTLTGGCGAVEGEEAGFVGRLVQVFGAAWCRGLPGAVRYDAVLRVSA